MRPKIKIVHIITMLELGGAQQNTLFTLQHIDREAFDPILITGRGGYLDQEALRLEMPVYFLSSLRRSVNPFLDFLAFIRIFLILKRERPQVVHTHSSKAGIIGRWAAWAACVPAIVHTFHGFGFHPEQSGPVRALYVWLERWAARVSKALVSVSQANRDEGLAYRIGWPGQYRIIRSGVKLGLYRFVDHENESPEGIRLMPGEKLITTIGPFKPQKNLRDFIHAASLIHLRHPETRFLMVGDGVQRRALEEEIRRRQLQPVFFLPGWRRDIPAILARTEIFALTSLWEGLPRSLVEAMVSGLPCVASAVNGVTDVIQNGVTGFLTAPRHPAATAERVIQLLENDGLAHKMGQRARAAIGQEFDIDQMVRRQEEMYLSLSQRDVVTS